MPMRGLVVGRVAGGGREEVGVTFLPPTTSTLSLDSRVINPVDLVGLLIQY